MRDPHPIGRCRPALAALVVVAITALALLAGGLGAPDPARAVETVPTQEDEAKVRQCLDAVRKAGSDARACVGIVADACLDAVDDDTGEASIACMSRESQIWQRLLDDSHKELKAKLDSEGQDRLVTIQESWDTYRTQRCALGEALFSDQQGAVVWRANCSLEETGRRAIELGEILDDLEAR